MNLDSADGEVVVEARKEILEAEVDDEAVMLDGNSGTYYGLNAVGRRIWELIQEPRSVTEISRIITSEYDVDEETFEKDLRSYLEDLAEEELIETHDGPDS